MNHFASPSFWMKKTPPLLRISILIVIVLFSAHMATGQISRVNDDRHYFYVRLAPGVSAYRGNLNMINNDKPFFGYAFKAGAGYVLTPELSAGFDYRVADYPRTQRPSVGDHTHNHTVNLFVNYIFFRWRDFEPYVLGGVGMTFFGTHDNPHRFKPAFGPVIGGGILMQLDNRFSLFAEGKIDFILDDEAMDELRGSRGMDAIGFFGIGMRVNL